MSKADRIMDEVTARLLVLVPGLTAGNVEKRATSIESLRPDQYPHVFLWAAQEEVELLEAWRQEDRLLAFAIDLCTNDGDSEALRQTVETVALDSRGRIYDSDTISPALGWETFELPDKSEKIGRLTFEGRYIG